MQLKHLTVHELAKYIADIIDPEDVQKVKLPTFNFAVSEMPDEEDLEFVFSSASGWYGIKSFDGGFDSDGLELISDYYGGGACHTVSIHSGLFEKNTLVLIIYRLISETLGFYEKVDARTKLIVEIVDEVPESENIVTEVCPHCENEVQLIWNTKERGYKAFCPICGNRLMLCDECMHRTGKCINDCDYSSTTDSCRFNKQ